MTNKQALFQKTVLHRVYILCINNALLLIRVEYYRYIILLLLFEILTMKQFYSCFVQISGKSTRIMFCISIIIIILLLLL